jgi:hypothetical protein
MPGPHEPGPFAGYAPGEDPPIGGYVTLMGVFATLVTAFVAWFRRSGRELPDGPRLSDGALLSIAAHTAARTLATDRVTSVVRAPFTELEGDAGHGEVRERPRGHGLRRAVGELLSSPLSLGMWMSAAFTAMLLVWPRVTRWTASVWAIFFGSELLELAHERAERAAGG